MKFTYVEGKMVHVGMYVGFKSDYEQVGQIKNISERHGTFYLTLENPNGFGGSYLRYATETEEEVSRCWNVPQPKKKKK